MALLLLMPTIILAAMTSLSITMTAVFPPVVRILVIIVEIIGNPITGQILHILIIIHIDHIVPIVIRRHRIVPLPLVLSSLPLRSHIIIVLIIPHILCQIHLRLPGILVLLQHAGSAVLNFHGGSIGRHHFAFGILRQPFAARAVRFRAIRRSAFHFGHLIFVVNVTRSLLMTRTASAATASARVVTVRPPLRHPWRRHHRRRRLKPEALSPRRLLLLLVLERALLLPVVGLIAAGHNGAAHHIGPALGAHASVRTRLRHVDDLLPACARRAAAHFAPLCVHRARLADVGVANALPPTVMASLAGRRRAAAVALAQHMTARTAVGTVAETEFAARFGGGRTAGRVVLVQIDGVDVVGDHIGRDVHVIGVVEDVGQPNYGGDVAAGIDAGLPGKWWEEWD